MFIEEKLNAAADSNLHKSCELGKKHCSGNLHRHLGSLRVFSRTGEATETAQLDPLPPPPRQKLNPFQRPGRHWSIQGLP